MDYFKRVCTIESALCELDTKSALRALIDWHGVQLFDEGFYRHLVDEGIIEEEEENGILTDETDMEEEMALREIEDWELINDWEDEGETLLNDWKRKEEELLNVLA